MMWKIQESSPFSRAALALSIPAFTLYTAGLWDNHWLDAKYTLEPYPGVVEQTTHFEQHMGLLKACVKAWIDTPNGRVKVLDDCFDEDPYRWQRSSSPCVFIGFIFVCLAFLGCVASVTIRRLFGNLCLKIALATCVFVGASLSVAGQLIHLVNKKYQINPPHPAYVDFNLDWCYILHSISVCIYAIVWLVMVYDIYLTYQSRKCGKDEEDKLCEDLTQDAPPKYSVETTG